MKLTIFFVSLILILSSNILAQSCVCEKDVLKQNWSNSAHIVIAEVISVEPSPKIWSGTLWVRQEVNYKLLKNIKGEITNESITVSHYVVKNSFTADEEIPQLSPKIFKKGESLLIFLNEDSRQSENSTQTKYISEDANCGALIATKSVTNTVESFR